MKNINKNRGITLVVLVITIILLLILAGITISQLAGNGIFEKVKEAKRVYENKQEEENEILNSYQEKISLYSDRSEVTVTELLNEPIVVATSTTQTDRNNNTTLNESISSYKMLIITYGTWDNTNKSIILQDSKTIIVDQIEYTNSNTADKARFVLQQITGPNYSYGTVWFKDSKTFHISTTLSSIASRSHFAITSIKGIN